MNRSGQQLLSHLLNNYRVVVIVKRSCPYCRLLGNILDENYTFKQGAFTKLDIEGRPDSNEIQDYMELLTKRRTVPQVFVNKTFIGGATDVEKLHSAGKLLNIFKEANAI
ncbi:hypothetical protein CHUAL_002536 [Chamberlinius hualienensis]